MKWRTGRTVPLNVYEGDRPMFQCHTPEAAARVVGLLNDAQRLRRIVERIRAVDLMTIQADLAYEDQQERQSAASSPTLSRDSAT